MKKKITQLESENTKVREELSELEDVARRVGHELHLERMLAGAEDGEDLRLRLKGKRFEGIEELETHVKEVREKMAKDHEARLAEQEEAMAKDKEIEELKVKLEKALTLGMANAISVIQHLGARKGVLNKSSKIKKIKIEKQQFPY